jgi:hypothetical protein
MQHRGVALLAITFKPQWTRSITLSSRMKWRRLGMIERN